MIFLYMHFGLISMIRNIDQYDGQSYESGLNLSYKHVHFQKQLCKMKKKLPFHFRILMYSKNKSKIKHMHIRSVI